ncbi:MAG: alcohol dehydrogenase catalytic domain-containing protein [Flavobacteriales bacterium]|nr:alcohol dehydrogenase catalytic domain-containing protein [Flavobacteriales bacterium]
MNNTNMNAAVYDHYGSPEVLSIAQVARPEPKDNEVFIRIHSTTVTSGDVRLRMADPFIMRLFFGLFKPKEPILGHEVAGVAEALGNKVTRFRVGDRVFGSTGMRSGTHAEYICLAEDGAIAHTPESVAHGEAATLTTGALAALHFIQAAELKHGEHILIHGHRAAQCVEDQRTIASIADAHTGLWDPMNSGPSWTNGPTGATYL